MKYIAIGLAFGAIWAAIQYTQDRVTDLPGIAGPVVLCGAFGGLLWLVRTIVLKMRNRS